MFHQYVHFLKSFNHVNSGGVLCCYCVVEVQAISSEVHFTLEKLSAETNIMESYFVAGSSKEATKTSVPSWSGRRNFSNSETSVEEHLMRLGLSVVLI